MCDDHHTSPTHQPNRQPTHYHIFDRQLTAATPLALATLFTSLSILPLISEYDATVIVAICSAMTSCLPVGLTPSPWPGSAAAAKSRRCWFVASVALVSKSICERNSTGALGSGPRISALSHGELTFAGATARFPELCAIGFKYPLHCKTLHRYTHSHKFQIRISIPTTDRAKSNASPAYTARRSFAPSPSPHSSPR